MLSKIKRTIQYLHSNHTANSYNVSVSPEQVLPSAFLFWEIQTVPMTFFNLVNKEEIGCEWGDFFLAQKCIAQG